MTLIQQSLWCDVLGRSANGVRPLLDYLREAEINQLEVPVRLDHDVLGLQVTIDYILGLEVFEYAHDLRAIEFSLLRGKIADAAVVSKQVATFQQLRYEVYVAVVLHEAVITQLHGQDRETYDERVIEHLEYFLLILNVVDVLRLNNIKFLHALDRELNVRLRLQMRELDITEGA